MWRTHTYVRMWTGYAALKKILLQSVMRTETGQLNS